MTAPPTAGADPPPRPVLPADPPAGRDVERTAALRDLRRFHRGERAAGRHLEVPGPGLVPALLHAYRDPARIRGEFPLLLPAPGAGADGAAGCVPLRDALRAASDAIAGTLDDARILDDNLGRLERWARAELAGCEAPVNAREHLETACRTLEDDLGLGAAAAERLHADLERLVAAVPPEARLLALSDEAPLHLFMIVARRQVLARRQALADEIVSTREALHERLRLEQQRGPGGGGELGDTVGLKGASYLDPAALARVMGTRRAPMAIDAEQCERIEGLIATLDAFIARPTPVLVHVVARHAQPVAWDEPDAEWIAAGDAPACRVAAERFDAIASEHARLFGALRAARLELQDAFDPDRHAELLADFGWEDFARDELLRLPLVVALESADDVASDAMTDLSNVLRSERPVEVIVLVHPAAAPGSDGTSDVLGAHRFELAYLAMSHREALVHQSSAARPGHLLDGYGRSVDAATASIHIVATGLTAEGEAPIVGPWLHAGAALESRAHPFFHYNPEAGATWARRLDFGENPAPDADWPVHELDCLNPEGGETAMTIAFTFADYLLLEHWCRDHFRLVPSVCPTDELVPIDAWLALPPEEAAERVPFVWGADEGGMLHRVVPDRQVVFAVRDRLGWWRTLQELAGVRNEHVQEAVAREGERLRLEFEAERAALADAHATEIERVRTEAGSETMRRLAERLVRGDLAAAPPAPTGPAPTDAAPPAAPAPAAESAPVPEPEPAAAPIAAGPWIDSALCTSCNDCIAINGRLFVYNANKQAEIGDPTAGTFAELVRAAEKCPARCIHPGSPSNPDEPNLDGLVKRAKPFQ